MVRESCGILRRRGLAHGVPVINGHTVPVTAQEIGQVLGDGDGAVPAARAAYWDCEIGLAPPPVLWEREGHEIEELFEIRLGKRVLMDVVRDLLRRADERLQFGNIVRVCKKSDIKNQV